MEWLRLRESLGGGVRQCLIRASTKEKKPKQILRKDEIRQRQEGEEKKGSFRGSAAAIQFQPAIITERWLFRWPQASNHRHKEGRSTNAAPYLSGLPGQRRENQQIMGNSVCRLLTTYIESTALCGVPESRLFALFLFESDGNRRLSAEAKRRRFRLHSLRPRRRQKAEWRWIVQEFLFLSEALLLDLNLAQAESGAKDSFVCLLPWRKTRRPIFAQVAFGSTH
ncbi:hypothetical protein J3E69DRAFT_182279 [Trichoderma sp. SZMC 28015]